MLGKGMIVKGTRPAAAGGAYPRCLSVVVYLEDYVFDGHFGAGGTCAEVKDEAEVLDGRIPHE